VTAGIDPRGRIAPVPADGPLAELLEAVNELCDEDYHLVIEAIIGMTLGKRVGRVEENLAEILRRLDEAGVL